MFRASPMWSVPVVASLPGKSEEEWWALMGEQGNTGVAGGTRGADPVPAKQVTAPDGSTVLGVEKPGSGQTEKSEDRTEAPSK